MGGIDDERGTRWVLHVDMDAFFASVEQLTRPTLRGRPVLVGGTGGRGVVAGASYEARRFGAHSAMPMHQARRLIGPAAVVVPPRGSVYRVVSVRVFTMLRETIPIIEMLSFDEAFGEPADLVGATRGEVIAFAEAVRARIATLGLSASIGAGSGKQIAKIASGMAKPDGVTAVGVDGERDFLRPLSVRKLWGVGPVAGDRLQRLGIETIGQLADMSTMEVSSVMGSTIGPALHRLANGIDDRAVAERSSAKQISAESTFADDVTSMPALYRAIDHAASSAHRRLVTDGRGARTVVVKLKRSDMSILTRSTTLATATTDLGVLTAAARRLALDPVEIGAIRLVGVGYSGLTTDEQFLLFGADDTASAPQTTESAESAESAAASDPMEPESPVQGVQTATGPIRDESGAVVWATGTDVRHPEFGHGWVQGSGHGVVSVRFETRMTGPGPARTFASDTPDLILADPVDSLGWPTPGASVDPDRDR